MSAKRTSGQLRSIHVQECRVVRQVGDANDAILDSLSGYSTGTATGEGWHLEM